MSLVVEVEQGSLRGVICDNKEAKYVAFKGIPYAKPPVGDLRFKAPEPPHLWEGVRDASEHGPVCPQYNERLDRMEAGSEDCLHLNVYSSSLAPPRPRPVLVWIHGGGFYTGSGNSDFYGPEFFMAHDLILVTVNYRLEVLGFLCLDNDDVPGNAGLKDQVAALKWVKKNIAAFGGDPNNITIFGCSAGAASASYHLLSKMSEGLFNKAICQSGICLGEWSYNLYARQRAFQLGKLLGKDTEDPAELVQFLRSVPASSLVGIQLPPTVTDHPDLTDSILFGPVIEKADLSVETFIVEQPPDLVKKGKIANVPIILGYTSAEGIEIARKLPYMLGFMGIVGAVVPRELKFKFSPEKLQEVDEKIRKYYLNSEEITLDKMKKVVKLETDALFAYNIQRFARFHALHSTEPTYLYKFTAETERNYTKKQYKMESVEGVCHADDLFYQFHVTNLDVPLTEESRTIIKQFVQLWADFASTGNPTKSSLAPPWPPFTEADRHCYVIGNTLKCVQREDDQDMKFWQEIYGENSLTRENEL